MRVRIVETIGFVLRDRRLWVDVDESYVITTVDLLDDGFGFKIEEQSSRGCDVTESGCACVSDTKKLQSGDKRSSELEGLYLQNT